MFLIMIFGELRRNVTHRTLVGAFGAKSLTMPNPTIPSNRIPTTYIKGDLFLRRHRHYFFAKSESKHLNTNAKAKAMHWVYVTRENEVQTLARAKILKPTGPRR